MATIYKEDTKITFLQTAVLSLVSGAAILLLMTLITYFTLPDWALIVKVALLPLAALIVFIDLIMGYGVRTTVDEETVSILMMNGKLRFSYEIDLSSIKSVAPFDITSYPNKFFLFANTKLRQEKRIIANAPGNSFGAYLIECTDGKSYLVWSQTPEKTVQAIKSQMKKVVA